MGSFSAAHLLVLVFLGLIIWLPFKLLKRMGFPGWWSLVLFVPVVNIVMIWVLAFKPWPCERNVLEGEVITAGDTATIGQKVGAAGAGLIGVALYGGYILLGLFQLTAIYAAFTSWLGWHWIIAGPIAFFVSYLPLIGTVAGMLGAVKGWGWEWSSAALLFFGPFAAIFVLAFLGGATRR